MSHDLSAIVDSAALPQRNHFPRQMRVLLVTTAAHRGRALAEALADDRATHVLLDEALGSAAGMAQLREQVYDAVLVSHEPDLLDALQFVDGLRAGGGDEPVLIFGSAPHEELDALCYEVGADGYVREGATSTRTLLWLLSRAIERCGLLRENRRLSQAERHRQRLEQQEAERLLQEQSALAALDPASAGQLPDDVARHYRELLKAHVMMSSGNLASELELLAGWLRDQGCSAGQAVQLHVDTLDQLIRRLGSRSARHVMNRANLLLIELLLRRCHQPSPYPAAVPAPLASLSAA
jgi:CheY-like chemotaxis protein